MMIHEMKRSISLFLVLCVSVSYGRFGTYTSFNSGELSPLLRGRTDVTKYYSGCRTLENMIVLSQGPVQKRPGTYYIASAKSADVACRLIPFEYSTIQAYVIELGNEYMRFYRNGGQILDDNDDVYEITTDYLTADLFDIQYIQSADTMYLVHPDYPPATLTRTAHNAWTLADVAFENGPFMSKNTTTTTITPSATTGTITLTASSSIFTANHVGSLWKLRHVIGADLVTGYFTRADDGSTSDTLTVQRGRSFDWTSGYIWVATLALQRSYDEGTTWMDVRSHVRERGSPNISFSGIEDVNDALYRVRYSDVWKGSGTCSYTLNARTFELEGIVEITGYTSSTVVTGTVIKDLGGTTATEDWYEGSFSADSGYPAAVAFYDERLAFGGTEEEPQAVWLSQTNDWEDFYTGDLATDALRYNIASDKVNRICWLVSHNAMLIGTTESEWKLAGDNPGEPLSSDNFSCKRQSTCGSDTLQALAVNNVILFVQRQAKKIRQFSYEFAGDTYIAPEISVIAEHLTADGIKEMALQKSPYTILWIVTDEGDLLSLTFEEFQEVVGFAKHTFDGDVESIAVISGTEEDEVWLSIKRTIGGQDRRYIEQMQPFDWGTNQDDVFFVDSGLSFDGGDAVTITDITQANPAVVTAAAHSFSDGDQVRITGVVGMTELNHNVYTVDDAATNTFSLDDSESVGNINSTNFTGYVSGGSVEQVENTFTTLTHLNGKTIHGCGDGGYAGSYTGSSSIVLEDYYNHVHLGLPYTARLMPMSQEFSSAPGALQGMTKRVIATTIRLNESLGCDIGPSWTTYDTVYFREASDLLWVATPLYTGTKRLLFPGGWSTDGDICVQQSLPLPFTILSLIVEYEARR